MFIVDFVLENSSRRLPIFHMNCDCGWSEESFTHNAIDKAVEHLRRLHRGGMLTYEEHVRTID